VSPKKKILVTGSGGFIFGNFIRQAFHTKQSYTIVSIDRVRDDQARQNIYINRDHSFHIADITDPHIINIIFQSERPDIVVHGAAHTFVDYSIDNALPFVSSNVFGTQVIIDACLKWNVERLIYIGTDEYYGHLTSENDPPWTEEAPPNPRNPYSVSKTAGELLVKAAHETHGLTYNITRSCNNYGPWQTTEKLLPKIIKNILNNQPVPIYGQGLQIRDWMHVFDNCAAIFKIINEGKDNEIYNIAANQEYSNIEVFQSVCNELGKGYDLIKFVEDRPGHDFRYSIDASKIKALGWAPEFKFKEGLKHVVEWYVMNRKSMGI
jgi:dTDP-glucose 4,6-dehydratase